MISGNKKNNVSRLRYTHLLSNALPFNSLIRIINLFFSLKKKKEEDMNQAHLSQAVIKPL